MLRSESIASNHERYASAKLLITSACFAVSTLLLAFNETTDSNFLLRVVLGVICGIIITLAIFTVFIKTRKVKAWVFLKQLNRGIQTLAICVIVLLTRGRKELLQLVFLFQIVLVEEPTPFCNLLRISAAVVAIVDAKSEPMTAVSVFVAVLDAFIDIIRMTVTFRSPQKEGIKILPILHPPHAKTIGAPGSSFQRNSAFGRMHEIRRIGSNPSRIRNQHTDEHPKSADLSSIHNSREDPTPQSNRI